MNLQEQLRAFQQKRNELAQRQQEMMTRAAEELTGNDDMGRGIDHFAAGLSDVFRHYAAALKPGAPFVFTYHHNDPRAYAPLVVAILDAGLTCTAALPTPAEMGASLHIAGTASSVLDTVFVCRNVPAAREVLCLDSVLRGDIASLATGGVRVTTGDIRCLLAGHLARRAVIRLRADWDPSSDLCDRMRKAQNELSIDGGVDVGALLTYAKELGTIAQRRTEQLEAAL